MNVTVASKPGGLYDITMTDVHEDIVQAIRQALAEWVATRGQDDDTP